MPNLNARASIWNKKHTFKSIYLNYVSYFSCPKSTKTNNECFQFYDVPRGRDKLALGYFIPIKTSYI